VLVSPEWAGMVPPGLKNFLLLCTPADIGHKPALAVTVSSGVGGSYPVTELRTSGYKNNKVCFIPEHVIVRSVEQMFVKKASETLEPRDQEIRARLSYSLKLLREYSQAFKGIRESGVIDNKTFPFGM
jgi:NAD(P)H-dependent FMN reductase